MSLDAKTVLVCLLVALGAVSACQRESSPGSGQKATEEQRSESAPAAVPRAEEKSAVVDELDDEDDLVLFAEGHPEEGPAPLTVRFTVESLLEGEMSEPKYTWNFGDGSDESHEASPTHTYTRPGEYTATVRVVDAEGQKGWDEVEIEVEAEGTS
jgi:hypothetical protein